VVNKWMEANEKKQKRGLFSACLGRKSRRDSEEDDDDDD